MKRASAIEGLSIPVEFLVMGIIENNVYIVGGGESCFVVDPSCDPQRILDAVGDRMVEAIVITHCHWDHTGAAAALREATGAPVVASAIDAPFITCELPMPDHTVRNTPCPVDRMVADGDVLRLASRDWRVIATPGHTAGGVCYFLPASHAHPGSVPAARFARACARTTAGRCGRCLL